MPCAQAAAQRERDKWIRENCRDVDEFQGITDPVEVLKIIHRPHEYDPLVRRIPCATPTDLLYTQLTRQEQHRLAQYARSLIGTDHNEEAESIVLCLTAFTDAIIEDCLRTFLSHDSIWPSMPFCRASPDIRDELIARVDRDIENRNLILMALAWIGDPVVADLFRHWRHEPPPWSDSLYVPTHEYSRQAGWELTDDGKRRDLYFDCCTKLVRGRSTAPQSFRAIIDAEDHCPWCGRRLTTLVDLVPSAFGVPHASDALDRVQVSTCEVCTGFGVVYGTIDETAHGRWSPSNVRPDYLPDDADDWGRLPRNSLTPAGTRSSLFAADQFLPTTFSQIGGHPTWIQNADYPQCPICSKTMAFLAQVDHADIENCAEGIFYAFVCSPCRTTATAYQQT
jgi:hypothetical protein